MHRSAAHHAQVPLSLSLPSLAFPAIKNLFCFAILFACIAPAAVAKETVTDTTTGCVSLFNGENPDRWNVNEKNPESKAFFRNLKVKRLP